MLFVVLLPLLSLCSVALSAATNKLVTRDDSNVTITDDQFCGLIVESALEGFTDFYAIDVYTCLTSVPFNATNALKFLDYYNETLQFQSTIAYLKNPPAGYKQPAVDVFDRLAKIRSNSTEGLYKNQYEFEAAVQRLVYDMHDGHVDLASGILTVFSFASPYSITSASKDGIATPQLYFTGQILDGQVSGEEPSPIVAINGIDAVEYITELAALNAVGNLEPHADWNQLMSNPAQDIQGYVNVFLGGITFYPGDDLNFTMANGTHYNTSWLATMDYAGFLPNGTLQSPLDFYNFFVLGEEPPVQNTLHRRQVASSTTSSTNPAHTAAGLLGSYIVRGYQPEVFTALDLQPPVAKVSWFKQSYGAYPDNPDIVQPDLDIIGGGFLTGYFFEDISTGILSIPTFQLHDEHIITFAETVGDFISNATAKKVSSVIIDLSQNTGGAVLLAVNTFKQFFPHIDPFGGSRRRSHHSGNVLGSAIDDFFDFLDPTNETHVPYIQALTGNEWVLSHERLNADTGKNFTSWAQYAGPKRDRDDDFSLTERFNLYDQDFLRSLFGGFIPYGYGPHNPIITSQPWKPGNIVILTDGLCGSACALFVEMMTHEAGVRTVAVGGRPTSGPMQAASGNRGAVAYDVSILDDDMEFAREIDDAANQTLPHRDNTGISITYAGFNLRDQIQRNDDVPLQFQYIPAHCRIYYSLANVYNMSQLWRDVQFAAWEHRNACVQGSLTSVTDLDPFNISSHNTNLPPSVSGFRDWLSLPTSYNISTVNTYGGLQDQSSGSVSAAACVIDSPCPNRQQCTTLNVQCGGEAPKAVARCLSACTTGVSCGGECRPSTKRQSKGVRTFGRSTILTAGVAATGDYVSTRFTGTCFPTVASRAFGCAAGSGRIL